MRTSSNNSYGKPKILFFSRSFYADFFSGLESELFISLHATLTHSEKLLIEQKGKNVIGCFEDEYERIEGIKVPGNYLETSLYSDRFLNAHPLKVRLEILSKEIAFWRNIIELNKPHLIINETVAIEISEVLAIEAALKGIKVISFLGGILPYSFYWKPNPFNGSLCKDYISNARSTNPIDQLKSVNYIKSIREANEKPYYIAKYLGRNRFSIKSALGETTRDTVKFIKKHISRIHKKRFEYEYYSYPLYQYSMNYLNSILFKYDLNEIEEIQDYIFYPMHYEPEATLDYFSEFYSNQAGTIINIAKCLKVNQYLVIKEHPQQFGILLSSRFRNIKKKYKNILFLQAEVPSEFAIKNCEAIVTLTSTAAWEGIILGKPVIVLGKIFFDNYPLINKVASFDELKIIIRNSKYNFPNEELTINYIADFISKHKTGIPFPAEGINMDENIKDFCSAIDELVLNKYII